MYTVKEAAEKIGLSEHTLRYYTDRDLVPGVVRGSNNNRMFDDDAIGWLHLIKCLRGCDMPIEEIRRFVTLSRQGESTLEERCAILVQQEARAKEQVQEAQERLATLQWKIKHVRELYPQNNRGECGHE